MIRVVAVLAVALLLAACTAPAPQSAPESDRASRDVAAPSATPSVPAITVDATPSDPRQPVPHHGIAWTGVAVTGIVDGDTLDTSAGRVRVIGYDTPERDRCGYVEATRLLERTLASGPVELGNPPTVDDADHYGRLLRYVRAGGQDAGLALIGGGLAHARYDSRDGYAWHPLEEEYRSLDARTPHQCG